MMKEKILIAFLLIAVVAVAGCTATQQAGQQGDQVQPDGTIIKADGTMIKPDGTMIKPDGTMIKIDGTMVKPDGTIVKPNGVMVKSDGTMIAPEGSPAGTIVKEDGTVVKPDGTMIKPEGTMVKPDGTMIKPDGTVVQTDGTMVKPDGTMVKPDGTTVKPDGTMVKPDGTMVKPDGTMILPNGTMIEPENKTTASTAGTGSTSSDVQAAKFDDTGLTKLANNYYRYEPAAYQRAISERRIIFLNFRANWCPICNAERPGILAGMNAINYPDVVGFEVHYNDDETKSFDNDLIKQHQVAYQHTKVIVDKNGNAAIKTLEGFDRDRTVAEIEKARAV